MKKTVVYTRLAESLLRFPETDSKGRLDLPHPSYNGKRVAVLNFNNVRTKESLEQYVEEFSSSGELRLPVVTSIQP